VARERERKFVALNATAVVSHEDALDAPRLQAQLDARGAGVDGVLDQFLDHRGRALDHLARGNLADQLVWQGADRSVRRGERGVHRISIRRGARQARTSGGPMAPLR
jgi:hypothetical protein